MGLGELIWGILTGTLCNHDWQDFDELKMETFNRNNPSVTWVSRITYVQKCAHCGKLRHYDVKAGKDA